jgi:serine/threonine-protein kinase
MGTVWAARHLELDVPVAVKFMDSTEAMADARTRFEREAKAAAQLRSPHVVQVLDYGIADGQPYLVMERLEGEDLGDRLERQGRLPLEQVASIVDQLSKGLKLAHDSGIIHRDIKPSNVFIARVGEEEIIKMLDFGVAKETRIGADASTTTTGQLVGSPAFMSPEQVRGGNIDHRADLWSLAVLAYVALTADHPFGGENVGDMLVNICTAELPTGHGLTPELEGFFRRALSKSPDGRYGSARELARALTIAAGTASTPALFGTYDEPTMDVTAAPAARIAAELQVTGATVSLSARRSADRRRGWWFALGGGGAVGLLWLASRAFVSDAPDTPETPTSPAAGPATAVSVVAPSAPSASAVASTVPSVAPPVRYRYAPRPAPRKDPVIDPKFGLPTKKSP